MSKVLLACMFAVFFALTGCRDSTEVEPSVNENGGKKTGYQKIAAAEARRIMEDGRAFILLDVRTGEEFADERIDGAVLLPNNEIRERAASVLVDKDMRVFVYCRSGRRSEQAANELAAMGYANVFDIGGIMDWPYETVGGKAGGN